MATTDVRFPGEIIEPLAGLHDPAMETVSAERLVELGEAIQQRLVAEGDDLEIGVSLQKTVEHVRVANTNGLDAEEMRSSIEVGIEATRAKSGDIFAVEDSSHVRTFSDINVDRLTQRVR